MDVLGKGIDIIAFVLVLIVIPFIWLSMKQDAILTRVAQDATTDLMEDIAARGYLSSELYEIYLDKLRLTGLVYDIEIEGSSTGETTQEIVEAVEGGETFKFSMGENVTITLDRASRSLADILSEGILNRSGVHYFRISHKITGIGAGV